MGLQDEIEAGRQTIRAESYSMSIGEVANLYRDQEIVIRPEFQRLFRWKTDQKSRLIESIILGIPIPSIFIMQREDNIWEVIDGLQRLSTILEFMGELRKEETGELLPPSTLEQTEYLPSLDGVRFDADSEDDSIPHLTAGQRLSLKRSKIDIKILLPESDDKAKYELFDRLNTGGSTPTAQEVRNAQLIMRDRSLFEWIERQRGDLNFQSAIGISDRRYEEGYDTELASRFLVLMNTPEDELKSIGNIDTFLSKRIFSYATKRSFNRRTQQTTFKKTFKLLNETLGDDVFRRFDGKKDRFEGPFSVSAFEAVSIGVGTHINAWTAAEKTAPGELQDRIRELWSNTIFRARSGSGMSSAQRIPWTVPEARKHFALK